MLDPPTAPGEDEKMMEGGDSEEGGQDEQRHLAQQMPVPDGTYVFRHLRIGPELDRCTRGSALCLPVRCPPDPPYSQRQAHSSVMVNGVARDPKDGRKPERERRRRAPRASKPAPAGVDVIAAVGRRSETYAELIPAAGQTCLFPRSQRAAEPDDPVQALASLLAPC